MNQVSNLRVEELGCELQGKSNIYIYLHFWGKPLNDNKEFFKGKPKEQKKLKCRRTAENMRSTKFWKLKGVIDWMRGNCFNSTEKFKPQCCWGDARKGLKEKTKKELRHGPQKTEAPVQGSRWEVSPGKLLFGSMRATSVDRNRTLREEAFINTRKKKFFKYRKRNDSIALLSNRVSVVKEGESVWRKCKRISIFHLVERKSTEDA